ncbi:hypothetical protein CQ020_06285 [Arthrobacter sp. MYb23]|nr:hypothetical protein CQ020_06285 [Arthrobacter sp. MYb23]
MEVAPHALADPSVIALVQALRISGKKLSHQLENLNQPRPSSSKPPIREGLDKSTASLESDTAQRP